MKKSTTINVAITPKVKKQLAEQAAKLDMKVSDVVRWAINSYLEAQSKEAAAGSHG